MGVPFVLSNLGSEFGALEFLLAFPPSLWFGGPSATVPFYPAVPGCVALMSTHFESCGGRKSRGGEEVTCRIGFG